MYSLMRSIRLRRMLLEQTPALAGSFVVAEMFYKLGSFTLECLAFLATWAVFDAGIQLVRSRARPRQI